MWHASAGPCASGQKQLRCFQLSSGSSSSEERERVRQREGQAAALPPASRGGSELLLPRMDWMVKLEMGAAAGQHLLGSSLLLILGS